MISRKQNLFLFFEENEWAYNIQSKLVQLAMNRFVIDEDAQFEVIKIYHLTKVKREMMDFRHPEFKNYVKERTEKEAHDLQLISDALNEAKRHQKHGDPHFIFGSFFHQPLIIGDSLKPKSRLLDWIVHQKRIQAHIKENCYRERSSYRKRKNLHRKQYCLESLHCTFYHGRRMFLISRATNIACYKGKMGLLLTSDSDFSRHVEALEQASINIPRSSINDDLENFIQEIQNRHRPSDSRCMLYLNKMLTSEELKQVEKNDMSFWKTLGNGGEITWKHKDMSFPCEDSQENDKKNKFLFCACIRYTEFLQ